MIALLSSIIVDVFFATDSAAIPRGTQERLAELVQWADDHPMAKVVIDGNADDRGSPEYNAVLSLKRASAVREQLKMLGVDDDRMIIVGYGENGLRRSERALDRRVTVWTTEEPLYVIVDLAMERAAAVLWETPRLASQIDGPRPTQVTFR